MRKRKLTTRVKTGLTDLILKKHDIDRFEYARKHGICTRCGTKFEPDGHTVCPRCREILDTILAKVRQKK